ncbi:short-chain dehydrogenase of unknown substrate specificity [Corynebacterium mustelae]|uniref:Ketoreductase domain-containing protein n=1 Tax=Corynebacterium mustelae TaxID=571915 RepID=A0A0G3GW45_9CORY|nr:SDR family NAD(P)-dependent oxidoreductase [Corynebacterium mustelae]AKK05401.1 short-chain dehydrogenase of unknown substrate specificity [Corynebacterium mustelae]
MRTIVITGASAGIGAAAARHIAHAHPKDRLILVGRNKQRTEAIAAELSAIGLTADFADLADVIALASDIRGLTDRIDVLANNAGGLFDGPTLTRDGFELTFQVNHLAPMVLTWQLLDTLIKSGASVVSTSSRANVMAKLDLTDLNGLRNFNSGFSYANAKLANILFTQELHRRYNSLGLNSVAFHPGVVATNFSLESHTIFRKFYSSPIMSSIGSSAEQGGENLAYFIDGTPGIMWKSGEYYSDNRKPGRVSLTAKKPGLAQRHFEVCSKMLGIEWKADTET